MSRSMMAVMMMTCACVGVWMFFRAERAARKPLLDFQNQTLTVGKAVIKVQVLAKAEGMVMFAADSKYYVLTDEGHLYEITPLFKDGKYEFPPTSHYWYVTTLR